MFPKLAILFTATLAIAAAARPHSSSHDDDDGDDKCPTSQCNTGDAYCCNSVTQSDSPGVADELGLLGIVIKGINVPVAFDCSPITAFGLGSGSSWSVLHVRFSCIAHLSHYSTQQPVCCQNNQFSE